MEVYMLSRAMEKWERAVDSVFVTEQQITGNPRTDFVITMHGTQRLKWSYNPGIASAVLKSSPELSREDFQKIFRVHQEKARRTFAHSDSYSGD